METAKVDIRKLQLLNDRINQVIDALNQVRLSVHGIQQPAAGPFGISQQVGYPLQGAMGGGYGQAPFGLAGAYGQQAGIPGLVPGLSHTGGYGQSPFGLLGLLPQQQASLQGLLGTLAQAGVYGQSPLALQGLLSQQAGIPGLVPGLSHTGGYGQSPFGVQNPYAQQGGIQGLAQGLSQAGSYGQSPFGVQSPFAQLGNIPGIGQGLSHTGGYGLVPQLQNLQNLVGLQNPLLAQALLQSGVGAGQIGQGGLSHTSPELLDATTRQVISATFPFASWNYSPFLSTQ